jgi:sortase A
MSGTANHHFRRLLRVAGSILIVAGVLSVAWGIVIWRWGDPFTALYTAHEQRALERQYAELEQTFAPVVQPASSPAAVPGSNRAVIRGAARRLRRDIEPGEALGRIQVPALGLNMVFVAGTDTASLRKGPGWDARTFLPGEGNLVYIAGHRTTYGAPFGNIDRMRSGDKVTLSVPYGTFVYRVTRSVIVPSNDLGRLVSRGREELALQACHPRFSASERYIVYARPVSVLPATSS